MMFINGSRSSTIGSKQGKSNLFDPPHKPGHGFRKDFDDLPKMNPEDVKNHMGY